MSGDRFIFAKDVLGIIWSSSPFLYLRGHQSSGSGRFIPASFNLQLIQVLPSMIHWSHCIPQVWRRLKSCHLRKLWELLRSGEGCQRIYWAKVHVTCLVHVCSWLKDELKRTGTSVITSQCTVWMRICIWLSILLWALFIQDVSWGF